MSFKKFVFACVLVGIFASAAAALNLNFKLVNRTGATFYRVYLKPSEISTWDADLDEIVGGLPLKNGETLNIDMSNNKDRVRYRHWDLRVYLQDGYYLQYNNINLSAISRFTIDSRGRATDDLGNYYD